MSSKKDVGFMIFVTILVGFNLLLISADWYRYSVQNDFTGDIELVATGEYQITAQGHFVDGVELEFYKTYWKSRPLTDAGGDISRNCLVEGNNYSLYQKTFQMLWGTQTSYFIEYVCGME